MLIFAIEQSRSLHAGVCEGIYLHIAIMLFVRCRTIPHIQLKVLGGGAVVRSDTFTSFGLRDLYSVLLPPLPDLAISGFTMHCFTIPQLEIRWGCSSGFAVW